MPDIPPPTNNANTDPNTALDQIAENCQTFSVDRLPIVAGFCHKIGIGNSINSSIESNADIDAGTIVTAMILDTLSGRTPLYRFHEFFYRQDTELLLGREIAPERFTDDALGRTLDRINEAGTMKLFTEISLKACKLFGVDTAQGHFDTTSVNVWGDYDNSTPGGTTPHITHGYSKDKRPDLKQFMFSLLCVEGNIPLIGKVEDGNAADPKLNNETLQSVAKLIGENQIDRDNFLYVADCKLVNEANLELIGDSPFVTRLPASYKVHAEAIETALRADDWEDLGTLNQTPTSTSNKRPAAIYKIAQTPIELYGRSYRAIIVHSTNYDKRRQKKLDKQLEEAQKKAQKAIRIATRNIYSCKKDATAALEKLQGQHHGGLWEISGKLEPKKIYVGGKVAPGKQRGIKRTDYRLSCEPHKNQELIEHSRARAGCFVLLSNTPGPGEKKKENPSTPGQDREREEEKSNPRTWTAAGCLRAYKQQYGIEANFSFLKEPLIANDVFLKNPGRIDALGLVLLLSLLVWSLMQRSLRKSVEENPDRKLTDLANRPTTRPTAFILMHKFLNIMILKIGSHRRLAHPLTRDQDNYLHALGLDRRIFTTPPGKNHIKPMT
jgi:transposase